MAFVPKRESIKTSGSKLSIDFVFDASSKRLTINDDDFLELLFVINTTDNVVIYDPSIVSKGGTKDQNRMAFTFDTPSMSDADDLIVIYEPVAFMSDQIQETLLQQLVHEMKIMNLHMSMLTDVHIRIQDIGE